MKLTIFAVIVFVVALWPRLSKYHGPVPEPQKHALRSLKEVPTPPTRLHVLADRLKLRL